jgi:hypothetical protein
MSAKGCFDDCTTDCCPDTYDKFRENRNKISSALAGALVSPQLLFLSCSLTHLKNADGGE